MSDFSIVLYLTVFLEDQSWRGYDRLFVEYRNTVVCDHFVSWDKAPSLYWSEATFEGRELRV